MAAETTAKDNGDAKKSGAEVMVEFVQKTTEGMEEIKQQMTTLKADIDEAKKPVYPTGMSGFNIRKGEDPMTSRGYSLQALGVSLMMRNENTPGWRDVAKIEHDLSDRLSKEYFDGFKIGRGALTGTLVPLGAELLPTDTREIEVEEGRTEQVEGLSKSLVQECSDLFAGGVQADPDEIRWMGRRIRKDLSSNVDTTGGTLVGFASQGELIEDLKAREVFSRAGAQQIDLPPQGKIRFPAQRTSVTIESYSEAATVTESTPTTGELSLSAKAYSGLVDIPDELMKFATSVSVEAWLRSEFSREIALEADRDMINGVGGNGIRGVIQYGGLRTVVATTDGANGDTLETEDPLLLYADIADQDAPVDQGFFFAMTNTLWASLLTRKTNAAGAAAEYILEASKLAPTTGLPNSWHGFPVITSTQVPTNRSEGNRTDLTLVLGGVGREWIIARAGVVEVAMTNSDASKFQQRISTMRGTQYLDAGPRHEESFGMLDTLLNT